MLTLAGHLLACLFWGTLIAILLMFLMHVGIVNLSSRRRYTLLSALVYFICFFFLMWQTVRLMGAVYMKGYVDDIRQSMEGSLAQLSALDATAVGVKDQLSQQYPFLADYISDIPVDEISPGQDAFSWVDYVVDYVHYELNGYIAWRVGYMLLTAVVFALLLTRTMRKKLPPSYVGINWN